MSILEKNKSKKKQRKSNKIVFDSEVITKDVAEKLIGEENVNTKFKKSSKSKRTLADDTSQIDHSKIIDGNTVLTRKKRKRKKNIQLNGSSNGTENKHSSKKEELDKTNDEDTSDSAVSEPEDETEAMNKDNKSIKTEESIRARKRRRHMELLQEKKLRGEVNLQQKCLNYLSRWKHSKSEWKFEKLKQVWLQQNIFDDTKVPDEFWNTVIEYFNNSKGQVKSNILSEAVKIVDSAENLADESPEKTNTKYLRARDIVQNIQE